MRTSTERLTFIRERLAMAFAAGRKLNLEHYFSGGFVNFAIQQSGSEAIGLVGYEVSKCGASACMVGYLVLDPKALSQFYPDWPSDERMCTQMHIAAERCIQWLKLDYLRKSAFEALVYADTPTKHLMDLDRTSMLKPLKVPSVDPEYDDECDQSYRYVMPHIDEARLLRLLDLLIAEPFDVDAFVAELLEAKQEE